MVTNKFKILIVFFVLIATQFIHADSVTIDILKKNVEQGHARDQHALAVAYKYGKGVEQNYKEAVKWYQLASDQGYAESQYNLGVMYDQGKGVKQDKKEAMKWYKLSADQGFSWAIKALKKAKIDNIFW